MMRRVSWSGRVWLVSGDRLNREATLRIEIAPEIPEHGGRRVVVKMTKPELSALIRQLEHVREGLPDDAEPSVIGV